jgi:hypothetical protein
MKKVCKLAVYGNVNNAEIFTGSATKYEDGKCEDGKYYVTKGIPELLSGQCFKYYAIIDGVKFKILNHREYVDEKYFIVIGAMD